MFIVIKAKDIVEGVRNEGQYCPIALAIKRKTGAQIVEVGTHTYTIDGKERPLSRAGLNFVFKFDTGQHVKPGLMWI